MGEIQQWQIFSAAGKKPGPPKRHAKYKLQPFSRKAIILAASGYVKARGVKSREKINLL